MGSRATVTIRPLDPISREASPCTSSPAALKSIFSQYVVIFFLNCLKSLEPEIPLGYQSAYFNWLLATGVGVLPLANDL